MKKKLLAVLLTLTMVVSMTACGGKEEEPAAPEATPQAQSTPDDAKGEAPKEDETAGTDSGFTYDGEEVTLSMMTITGGEAEGENFYVDILPELVHKQFPNITVEVEELPSDNYKSTVKMKFASGEGPDIFEWWAGEQGKTLVEAGYLKDMSGMDFIKDFREDMVDSFSFDGKPYAVPLGLSFLTTWYNQDMFTDAGIEGIPQNWDEFIDACEKLKAKGYTPIVMGDKQSYVTQFGIYQIGASCIYADNPDFDDQLYTGETHFNDDCWVETLSKYEQLYKDGYVMKDTLGLSRDQARQAFIDGKAAMIFDGSFGFEALTTDENFKRGMFCVPSNEAGKDFVYNLTPAEGIFASANEDHQAAIEAVLNYWFTEGTELFDAWAEKNDNIPAHNSLADNRPMIQEYLERYKDYNSIYNLNNAWPDGVSDEMAAKFQEVISGKLSAADVAEAMQSKFEQVNK